MMTLSAAAADNDVGIEQSGLTLSRTAFTLALILDSSTLVFSGQTKITYIEESLSIHV